MKKILRMGLMLIALGALSLLVSCGGGGGSSSDSDGTGSVAQSTGSVGILLTDKPADLSLFSAVNATIESITLLGNDDEQVPLYSRLNATYDLLQLRNEAIPLIFEDNVPVGTYCKIRLTLSDLELVMTDGTLSYPKLTGNKKIDLLARDCFTVNSGEILTLQVDIDAGNSIHINSNNKGYNFRPVVFIDVIGDGFDPKLIRVEGEVTAIDPQGGTLQLCGAVPASDGLGCVEISVGENTAYFDNSDDNGGVPKALDSLFDDNLIGQMMTVVGWPRHDVQAYGEQKDADHPCMNIDALAIENGVFIQVAGAVASTASALGFVLDVEDEQAVSLPDQLTVQFYSAPEGGNGTRIVARTGALLTASEITESAAVQVDGALTQAADALNAALVIVETGSVSAEQVSGTIFSVDTNSFVLTPDSATVCGSTVTEQTIGYGTDTSILTVTVTDAGSLVEHGGVLTAGQTVSVAGYCENDGFNAAGIVIIDDQASAQ